MVGADVTRVTTDVTEVFIRRSRLFAGNLVRNWGGLSNVLFAQQKQHQSTGHCQGVVRRRPAPSMDHAPRPVLIPIMHFRYQLRNYSNTRENKVLS